MSTPDSPQFSRTPIYIALGLSLALVVGVIAATKIVYEQAAHRPVALPPVPAPAADSPACAALLDALPDELAGFPRATLADPAPPGAAAWAHDSTHRITLRCGINLPLQYTALSETTQDGPIRWLPVTDPTPGSSLHSFFAVNRSPIVGVTVDVPVREQVPDVTAPLADALSTLPEDHPAPHPLPLSDLPAPEAERCAAYLAALPATLGDYQRSALPAGLDPASTAAWTAPGREPVVLRCGVSEAPGYRAGERVTQVDDVAWFQDPTVSTGTTAATWYPLDRDVNIAVSIPQAAGDKVIAALSVPEAR